MAAPVSRPAEPARGRSACVTDATATNQPNVLFCIHRQGAHCEQQLLFLTVEESVLALATVKQILTAVG